MRIDLKLLAAWRKGDPDSGSDLFERHFASICRFFANAEVFDIPGGTARGRIRGAKEPLEQQLTALASDDSTLESTVSGPQTWARGLRAQVLPKENG